MNTRLQIKICGMRDAINIVKVGAMKPDFMGFIFYPGSPRYVGEQFGVPVLLPETVKRVGVFVDTTLQAINRLADLHRLNFLQLHGTESPDYCRQLKKGGWGVVKAFGIGREFDFSRLSAYAGSVDYFLFDTKGPHHGGHGKPFDWSALAGYQGDTPFLLSGGLSPENIGEVLLLRHPQLVGVDINSGAEIEPGVKDLNKIVTIMNQLHHE